MFWKIHFQFFLVFFLLTFLCCSSQETGNNGSKNKNLQNLKPVFAGQFYPSDKAKLENNLTGMFASAEHKKIGTSVLAIIVPHAGYVFSGTIAASAYNQTNEQKIYENVFIITASHHEYFKGASIYSVGNCETPLGEVPVNLALAKELIDKHEIFSYVPEAHYSEHSLEVQLPFIQHKFKKGYKIIPIVIGSQSKEDCNILASALLPYFNDKNLFIISSDFSHYPDYDDAVALDKQTAKAILANNTEQFTKLIFESGNKTVPGLATRACGWSAILTLMYLTKSQADYKYTLIDYANSGESIYGDKDRVVGYNAITVEMNHIKKSENSFSLEANDKKVLLELARTTIETYTSSNEVMELNPANYSKTLKTDCGAFVTLNKNHQLRGCIGRFDASEPLYLIVQQMAIAAATQDSRFLPVNKGELKDLEIEISVLSPMRKINSVDEIILGKHGIYIVKGSRNGTFLPQVATETGWTLEEFLGHCSRDKAGLGWDGWKEADIYVYEAIVFSESELK